VLVQDSFALSERAPRKARGLLRSHLSRSLRSHIGTMDQIAVIIINTARPALLSE
jgi:hypothetical protein